MSDLIRRQDAILALLEKGQCSRRYKLGEIWELNFDEIREALATVPSADAWIPISEKLPEVRQWVLCQCRAGIMDVLRLTADGSWYKGYPNAEYMGGFVVAWMPLPKPYEVEE